MENPCTQSVAERMKLFTSPHLCLSFSPCLASRPDSINSRSIIIARDALSPTPSASHPSTFPSTGHEHTVSMETSLETDFPERATRNSLLNFASVPVAFYRQIVV